MVSPGWVVKEKSAALSAAAPLDEGVYLPGHIGKCAKADRYVKSVWISRGEFLFEAGPFSGALAQEIQVGPADMGVAIYNHFLDQGGPEQEGALYPNSGGGDAADGEVRVIAAFAGPDHRPFEFLDPLPIALANPHVDADGVPRANLGDVGIFRCFN